MALAFGIASLVFSGGDRVELDDDALVVVVGPNNAGKTSLLREIAAHLREERPLGPVLRDLALRQGGSEQEFEQWLEDNLERVPGRSQATDGFRGLDAEVRKHDALAHWRSGVHFRLFAEYFFHLASTEARLTSGSVAMLDFGRQHPRFPLHVLYLDEGAERRFSDSFRRAFGLDLVVDRLSGSTIVLRCGIRPDPQPGEDRLSPGYQLRVRALSPLNEQGDGMRSFVGCLLHAMVASSFITMIDEPEAFLHPPQARLLGAMLTKNKRPGHQLVLSTHSGDVLRGLLDAGSTHLTVLRISRTGDLNKVSTLNRDEIRELWGDPILRFSVTRLRAAS